MGGSTQEEVEVKLPFRSASEALQGLQRLGAKQAGPRRFEDNVLVDRAHAPLAPAGKLLRVRRSGGEAWLTFKGPVPGEHRHKVREEHETSVDDPDAVDRILAHLGFSPCYRYQKYRTHFEFEQLAICLDETPIGCFVELEGQPEQIDNAARSLGFDEKRYVLASYRELHLQAALERDEEPGDLVFATDHGS